MNHLEATLKTMDGIEFHYESWEKSTGSYGKIGILLNGIGEYCGVNNNLINFLVENGFKVFSPDLPGFGKTNLKKTKHSSLPSYLNCFQTLLENIQATAGKSKKIVVFANDITCLLILAYLTKLKSPVTKFVFFSPLIELAEKYFSSAYIIEYCLFLLGIKKYKTIQLKADLFSDQEKFIEIYNRDKNHYKKIPLRFFIDCQNFNKEIMTKGKILNKSDLICIHGNDDKLTDINMISDIIQKLHFTSIKIENLLRTKHNVFYGKYSNKIFTILTEWFSNNNI